jgi:hypothetical protein
VNREIVTTHLLRLIDDLERSAGGASRDLLRAASCIEHVVMSDLFPQEEEEAILADPRMAARMCVCQAIFSPLESSIERSMAEVVRVLGAESIWGSEEVSQHYIARYEYLARCEIELARMGAGDRVLFIGSGFLPITAFEYARQCGCRVDCVDFVPEAIECARKIAEGIDMAEQVRFFQTRGEDHDPSPYDVILVGVLALPKQGIFARLDAGAKRGCRILCRTTYGLRQLVYQQASYDARALRRLVPGGRSAARGERVISAELLTVS